MSEELQARVGLDTTPLAAGYDRAVADTKKFVGRVTDSFSKLERDNKVKNQITGLATDLAAARNPAEALGFVVGRLSETFKTLLSVAVGVGVGLALKKSLEETAAAATKVFDAANDISGVNIAAASEAGLKKIQDDAKRIEQEAGETGWFGKWLYGEGIEASVALAQDAAGRAKAELQSRQVNSVKVENQALSAAGPDAKAAAEAARINLEYEQKIAAAIQDGNTALAEQLGIQRDLKLAKADATAVDEKNKAGLKTAQVAFEQEQGVISEQKKQAALAEQLAKEGELYARKKKVLEAANEVDSVVARAGSNALEKEKAKTRILERNIELKGLEARETDRIARETEKAANELEQKRKKAEAEAEKQVDREFSRGLAVHADSNRRIGAGGRAALGDSARGEAQAAQRAVLIQERILKIMESFDGGDVL